MAIPHMLWAKKEKERLENTEDDDDQFKTKLFTKKEKIGLSLFALGFAFHTLCRYHLGKFYTFARSIKSNHTVVDTGPYSIIRHPGYVANFIMFLGNAFFTGHIISYLSVAVPCILMYNTPKEDEFMRGHFGEEWDKYTEKVKYRVLPYVW